MNRILLSLLASALVIGGLFYAGYLEGVARCEAAATRDKLAAVARAIEQADELERQDAEVAVTAEAGRKQREARSPRLDAAIDRYFSNLLPSSLPQAGEGALKESHANPVNPDCGLDADGLRLWNAANSGADIDGPGVLNAGVQRLAPGPERRLGDAHPQPQIGD